MARSGLRANACLKACSERFRSSLGLFSEFPQEMVNASETCPCRREASTLLKTLEVKIACEAHVIQGTRNGDLVGAKIILKGPGTGRDIATGRAVFTLVEG